MSGGGPAPPPEEPAAAPEDRPGAGASTAPAEGGRETVGEASGAVLFDSHLHLTDPRLLDDLDAVLSRAGERGVAEMVTVGTDPADARRARELAGSHPGVWATAGLHPHAASRHSPDVMTEIEELARAPEVVAVGETGLDYHYDNSPRERQRKSFRAHLELAARLGMPAVVHSRDADADTAAILEEFAGRARGVMHCFTGGDELLDTALEAGWHVSFTGIVTFRGYDGSQQVRRAPADRLMVETDSPYLSPEPVRGRRNEPAHLIHVCRRVAEFRRESAEEVARTTRRNARSFYGLDEAGLDDAGPEGADPDDVCPGGAGLDGSGREAAT